MRGCWSDCLTGRRSYRLIRHVGLVLGLGLVGLAAGCGATFASLTNDSGEEIRLTAITRITNDSTLTDEQKREALRDLGITDEDLLDMLVREL